MTKKYSLAQNSYSNGGQVRQPAQQLTQSVQLQQLVDNKDGDDISGSSQRVEKKGEAKASTVSFLQLYKYSSSADKLALVIGAVFTFVGGWGIPLCVWYSSSVLNEFYSLNYTTNNTDEVYNSIVDISKESAVVLAVLIVCLFVFLFIGMMSWLRAADRIVKRVRSLAFNNIIRQHMGFFDLNEPGAIITSLAEDCVKYQSGMGEKVVSSMTWFSQMIGSVIVAFVGDWLLALVAFALLPITLLATGLASKYIRKLSAAQFNAYSKAGVVAEESISAIRIVQAFCGEEKQVGRYEDRLIDARKLGQKAGYFVALANCIAFLIALLVIALVFWIGGIRYLDGYLNEPGALIQVTLAAAQSLRSFSWIANSSEFITTARAAAGSMYKYIEVKSEIDSLDKGGKKLSKVTGTITFENVYFEYPSRPDVPVLKGLTLTIPAGKNVALVGPSGCGKSTTIQLLQRFYDPRKGQVKVDGTDIKECNLRWLRQQIGVVAQEPVLFATTVEENIKFGRPNATHAEVLQCAKEADAHGFIMQLPDGYETVLNEAATLLSRGEKQRISLARALIRQPKILLLDECTSALDTESEVVVQQALEKASRGRTTITIAHRLSTVRNSDTLYVINEGVLWEEGNHDELMEKNGLYKGLVANQMKGMDDKDKDVQVGEEDIMMEQVNGKIRAGSIVSTQSATDKLQQLQEQADATVQETEGKPKADLKRIFSYNKPEACVMIVGCVCSLIFGFGLPAMAILIGELFIMFRSEDPDEQHDILFLNCPIMIAVVAVCAVAAFIAFATLKYAGEWLTQRLRIDVFRSIVQQEIGWFDRKENQVGALTSRLANDASLVQAATGTVLVTISSAFSTLTGAILVAVIYGWQLGVPLLLYTPFTLSIGIIQGVINTKFSQWTANASRAGGKIIAEVIDKIHVVASLTKEEYFEEKFNSFFDELAIKERKKALYGGLAWGATYVMIGGSFLLSFPYGLLLVAEQLILPENIVRILFGVSVSTLELARLNVYATEFTRARAAAAQLFVLIDRKSKINPHDPSGLKPKEVKGELEIRNAYFNYPTRPDLIVLRGLSLEVKRGQFIAMVGPSGSGKTSAITLFQRFYDIMGGEVLIDGHRIYDLNLNWVRSQMSIVTQDPILFNIPLRDNIAFGDNTRDVSMDEIMEAARCANIHSFIASLPHGYDTPAGTKGTQLSGGQKQRVSIARALVRNPKLLLLDDAMSALDAESEEMVEVALEKAREGRTTIMVSHRLSSILKADVIYFVENGRVLEKGTHSELMARKSHYYKLQQASLGLSE